MSLILDLLNLFHAAIYTCIYCMILHCSGNAMSPVYEMFGTVVNDGTRLNIIFVSEFSSSLWRRQFLSNLSVGNLQ